MTPSVFLDPTAGEEYARISADEFPDGDGLESTEFEEPRVGLFSFAPGASRGEFGWIANDRSYIASFTIPGTTRRIALRKGDCSVVLLDFMAWFDKNIESIDGGQLDDWGYAERTVRGSSTVWSRHAWGGAGDLNALKHPMGLHNTFTREQQAKIRAKVRTYNGALRWGGDYNSRPDDMHIEINTGPAGAREMANLIRARRLAPIPPKPPVVKPPAPNGWTKTGDRILGITNPPMRDEPGLHDVSNLQHALRVLGNPTLKVTKVYDRDTANVVQKFKQNRRTRFPGIFEEAGFGDICYIAVRKALHG